MDLAMKTGHELVTKNLSGAINGTQLNLVNASGATEVFGFTLGRRTGLERGRSARSC
jgi:hypothetical protein